MDVPTRDVVKQRRVPISVALISLLIGALAVVAFASRTATNSPGQIELSATEFDFGIIPNTEAVSEVFQVRNVGQGWLEITGLSTSCGCTAAEVDGRRLGPGEVTALTVTYDPQVHNGETGDFMRRVYVRSNDPTTPEASLTIRVTVAEP